MFLQVSIEPFPLWKGSIMFFLQRLQTFLCNRDTSDPTSLGVLPHTQKDAWVGENAVSPVSSHCTGPLSEGPLQTQALPFFPLSLKHR